MSTCLRRSGAPSCTVVIVRQRIRGGIARERRVDGKQLRLDLAGPSVHEGDKLWEYAVLVTDVAYPLESIGQLYRDRADAENAFDELKNQWGMGGFTTQDINRCQTVARACALVYNWWSWYCRAAHSEGPTGVHHQHGARHSGRDVQFKGQPQGAETLRLNARRGPGLRATGAGQRCVGCKAAVRGWPTPAAGCATG
jgi:hypothetical protein